MKVRVRDDDVLVAGIYYKSVFARFCRIHDIIVANGGIHVPTILCSPIMDHPECIEFIRQERARGTMVPELHGWSHIDYGLLSEAELNDDLGRCVEWFKEHLDAVPSVFYTPWGADSPLIRKIAATHGMTLGECTKLIRPFHVINNPERHGKVSELSIHWWDKKDRRTLEEALKIWGEHNEG